MRDALDICVTWVCFIIIISSFICWNVPTFRRTRQVEQRRWECVSDVGWRLTSEAPEVTVCRTELWYLRSRMEDRWGGRRGEENILAYGKRRERNMEKNVYEFRNLKIYLVSFLWSDRGYILFTARSEGIKCIEKLVSKFYKKRYMERQRHRREGNVEINVEEVLWEVWSRF